MPEIDNLSIQIGFGFLVRVVLIGHCASPAACGNGPISASHYWNGTKGEAMRQQSGVRRSQ